MDDEKKKRVLQLLQKAAAKAVAQGDPWAKYHLEQCKAERVIRHLYNRSTDCWESDESIVKMEPEPFTHGAMRFCYRMKKRAQPPRTASNHRFHKFGWSHACNYLAKAYYTKEGEIDCDSKETIQNDILLTYEAQHWASKFNDNDPVSRIHFIRAYAIEFPDRPGRPWMAVERFIEGKDMYGAGFVKHNTNAGFKDQDLRRVTPQVFSAFTFYKSHGKRLVADIQGVGDLYTDPQVLSDDYRFGDGDLGPRGMALFFMNFRSCGTSDAMGIPIFSLSKNELKHQGKYEDEEITLSDDELSISAEGTPLDFFQRLDMNRQRRLKTLDAPKDILPPEKMATLRRSNVTTAREDVSARVRMSLKVEKSPIRCSKSDLDEVQQCLQRALEDRQFTNRDFHRHESGELKQRHFKNTGFHRSNVVGKISVPMKPNEETKKNLAKVHYHLAVLHGSGRFPEVLPEIPGQSVENLPSHDAFSVLFHLSHGASLHNAPSCLALARVQAGLESNVSNLLPKIVHTDFDSAKMLLKRAMESEDPPTKPKVAAGCLLFQILHDEYHVGEITCDNEMMGVLEDTLMLMKVLEEEESEVQQHKKAKQHGLELHTGDCVEANFALEGTFYKAIVETINEGEATVRYEDDSLETLPKAHVRFLVPPTATQTSLGGPLTDEEAFGNDSADDHFVIEKHELLSDLAQIKERTGSLEDASTLYEEAADGAMAAGKMKTATKWSLKAAELCS